MGSMVCVCVRVCVRACVCVHTRARVWSYPRSFDYLRVSTGTGGTGEQTVGKIAISIWGIFCVQRRGTSTRRWLECRQSYKRNDIFNEETQSPPVWHRRDGIPTGRAVGAQD